MAFNRFVIVLAVVLLLFPSVAFSAKDVSLLVTVELHADGGAFVKERYGLLLNDDSEIEEFNNYRYFSQNTLTEWRRFSKNLKYHVAGQGVPVNPKLSAKRLLNVGSRTVSIELEYDVSHVVSSSAQGPRIQSYSFGTDVLSFDLTASREVILPLEPLTTLELVLPPDAYLVQKTLSPEPTLQEGNKLSWSGPINGRWNVDYSIEQPLGNEVRAYFDGLYRNGVSVIPLALPIVFVLLVGVFLVNKLLHER
ncbi:hypothetical protein AUJ14_01415 [Candidatus Micrarchaeota archaeon CG1_02_55_22]|nr:MAG: hypothetical protein AUJ14_01415 [Candidatus Micrarchaeota archaeon CG1_02_55_22]